MNDRMIKNIDSIGAIGTVGVGYRRLSKHEHSYVGINSFFDLWV